MFFGSYNGIKKTAFCSQNSKVLLNIKFQNLKETINDLKGRVEPILGTNYFYFDGNMYYVEENFMNFNDAAENCKTMFESFTDESFGNGTLFEPRDKLTNDEVINMARQIFTDEAK